MDINNQMQQASKRGSSAWLWVTLVVVIIAAAAVVYFAWKGQNGTNTNVANANNQGNTNSSANSNLNIPIVNSSNVSLINGANHFSNATSQVAFTFPPEWKVSKDSIADTGHTIQLTIGAAQGSDAVPYNNNGTILLEVLNKSQVANYDWPMGVGGVSTTKTLTIAGQSAEERISESTNSLAFPDNTVTQLSAGVLLVTSDNILIASLYAGGPNRNQSLTSFNSLLTSLTF